MEKRIDEPVGCLQVALSGNLSGCHVEEYGVKMSWTFGIFAADVMIDLGELEIIDDQTIDILRDIYNRLSKHETRVVALNGRHQFSAILESADLPFDVIGKLN